VSATVRQMLAGRGTVISVAPSTTVFEALQRMAERNIGAVLVLNDGRLVGIFTERDYARKVVLRGLNSKNTPVGDLMTGKVITVGQSWTADQCMALMTEHHVRHLPVVEDDRVLGVVSIGDAVKAVVDEQHFVIGQLTHYITQT
jgi:CBS domain-containing protein